MKQPVLFLCIIVLLCPGTAKAQVPAAGMKLWLRSDAGVYRDLYITPAGPNEKIRVWADQSGNGNDFFQADSDRQPLFINSVLCGKPALRFEQSRRTFLQSLVRMSGQKTVFIVFNLRPFTNAAQTLLSLKGNSNEFTEIVATDFAGYRPVTFIGDLPATAGGSFWRNSTGINATFSSQGNLVTMMYNGGDLSTPSSYDAYYDNAAAGVLTNGLLGRYIYDSTTIGARAPYHNINFLNGDIAEILVYDRLLTTTELAETSDYLLYKFGLANNCTLSLRMLEFKARPNNTTVELYWKTAEDGDTKKYELQYSKDGNTWQTFQSVPAQNMTHAENEYGALHRQPVKGWNFYRIIAFNEITRVFTSDIRKIYFDPETTHRINVFPNPAGETIFIEHYFHHRVSARLVSSTGKLIRIIPSLSTGDLNIKDLPAGIYFLLLQGEQVNTAVKFIKK